MAELTLFILDTSKHILWQMKNKMKCRMSSGITLFAEQSSGTENKN